LAGSDGTAVLNMNASEAYGADTEADPIRITLKIPEGDAPEVSRPATGSTGTFNVNTLSFSTVDFQGADGGFYYISYVADNPFRLTNMPLTSTNVFELALPGIDFTNAVMEMGVDFGPALGTKMEVNTVNQFNFLVPVELVYFRANKVDDASMLTWETSSEINNDFFDVERSADGKSFEAIGKILGNGTTTEVQNYEVNVTLDRAYDGVKIVNQLGQFIENIPASEYESNQFKLDLSAYAPGVYFLEAKLGHEIVNKQFVKIQ